MSYAGIQRAVSTANGQSPAPCARPTGLIDGDLLVAVVTVPTLTGTNSVVTAPGGWVEVGHFHATATSGMGITQAWFVKAVPVAGEETASTYAFTATNIGASRVLVQILRLLDRSLTNLPGMVSASAARSTSTAVTSAGSVTLAGDDAWDILYTGATRAGNTFTAPDTEVDNYNPAANTSSAIFFLGDQLEGTIGKTSTASTASSVGLGVLVAFPKYVAPVIPSPWRVRGSAGSPVEADLWVRGTDGAPVKISVT